MHLRLQHAIGITACWRSSCKSLDYKQTKVILYSVLCKPRNTCTTGVSDFCDMADKMEKWY